MFFVGKARRSVPVPRCFIVPIHQVERNGVRSLRGVPVVTVSFPHRPPERSGVRSLQPRIDDRRIWIVVPPLYQPFSHWVIQDIGSCLLDRLIVSNYPIITTPLPEQPGPTLFPPNLGSGIFLEIPDLIQNPVWHKAACASMERPVFTGEEPEDEMQVVRHQTIAKQNPAMLPLSPKQRFNDGCCQLSVGEGFPLMAGTNSEEEFTIASCVTLHGQAMLFTPRLVDLATIQMTNQLTIVFVSTHPTPSPRTERIYERHVGNARRSVPRSISLTERRPFPTCGSLSPYRRGNGAASVPYFRAPLSIV
jgi:hypothetical protein